MSTISIRYSIVLTTLCNISDYYLYMQLCMHFSGGGLRSCTYDGKIDKPNIPKTYNRVLISLVLIMTLPPETCKLDSIIHDVIITSCTSLLSLIHHHAGIRSTCTHLRPHVPFPLWQNLIFMLPTKTEALFLIANNTH